MLGLLTDADWSERERKQGHTWIHPTLYQPKLTVEDFIKYRQEINEVFLGSFNFYNDYFA